MGINGNGDAKEIFYNSNGALIKPIYMHNSMNGKKVLFKASNGIKPKQTITDEIADIIQEATTHCEIIKCGEGSLYFSTEEKQHCFKKEIPCSYLPKDANKVVNNILCGSQTLEDGFMPSLPYGNSEDRVESMYTSTKWDQQHF